MRALRIALLCGLLSLAAAAGGGPSGRVLIGLEEAFELCFPGCEIERLTHYLTEEERALAGRLAGDPLESAIVHPYAAWREGALVGTAYVDTHRVRTLRESLLVVVGPDGRARRVEVLAFAEPAEYMPRGGWYGQFEDRELDDDLHLSRGIRGISGATLTARATTEAVRRVLAVHRVLSARAPAQSPAPRAGGAAR
jgi:hypothetical protein